MTANRGIRQRAASRVGQRFGLLVVVAIVPHGDRRHTRARANCDCGGVAEARLSHIVYGATKSCGCQRGPKKGHTLTHGLSHTIEYASWRTMHARCSDPSNQQFHNYGGRGVRVCARWTAFENFYADMGRKPSSRYSLDRVNVNGNYEPANCRWATSTEQNRNRRNNRIITIGDENKTLAEWAERSAMNPLNISRRLARGWSPKRAVFTPLVSSSEGCRRGRESRYGAHVKGFP